MSATGLGAVAAEAARRFGDAAAYVAPDGEPLSYADLDRRSDAAAGALRMAVERKLTGMGGIPTQLALMMREPGFDDADLSSLRSIVMGGGPATPALVQEIRRRFKVPVLTRYSCTEAGLGTGTRPDDPPEDAEISVGRPQRGVELPFDS